MDNQHTLESCFQLTKKEAVAGTEFLSSTGSNSAVARRFIQEKFLQDNSVIDSEDSIIQAAKPTPAQYFLYTTGFGLNVIIPHSTIDGKLVSSAKLTIDRKLFDLNLPYPAVGQDLSLMSIIGDEQKHKLVAFLSVLENMPVALESLGKVVQIDDQVYYHLEDQLFPSHPRFYESNSSSRVIYQDAAKNAHQLDYKVYLFADTEGTAPTVYCVDISHNITPKEAKQKNVTVKISTQHLSKGGYSNKCKLEVGSNEFVFDSDGFFTSARGEFTSPFRELRLDYPLLNYASVIAHLGNCAAEKQYKPLPEPLQTIIDRTCLEK